MTVLQETSGTLVNIGTVLLGSSVGLALRGRLPERIVTVVMQAIGLVTLFIGIDNAFDLGRVQSPPGIILGLMALALGGALGEWWRLEEGLEAIGATLKRRFRGQGRFTEGFVAATLLFCVGPLTLIGSIQNGLSGETSFLLLKATLDGFSSLALATTFGFGVIFSVLVIAVYQGGLSLAAGLFATLIPDPAHDPRVLLVNGVGGLLIVALGLGLLDIKRVRTAAMLPSLVLVVLFYYLGRLFT
ncbi:MAG: DUF554 domain-containing protein [Deinococcales bacterium]|jgi:uncharacterized membrane protein YqgA involved in biofilm formation